MIILGIETSCDETAASIIEGKGNDVKVLSNVVSSQIEIHKKYGGVIPEVAAREHVLNIIPVINEALEIAKIKPLKSCLANTNVKFPIPSTQDNVKSNPKSKILNPKLIDAIAVTVGPGLITSLIVGVETARNLAYAWNLPLIGVNHIEGHIYANFVGGFPNSNTENSGQFPILILTVSGGHTMLVLMKGHGKFKTIGETRDDAAGEAFDKAAQMLGIGYPGGPAVAANAAKLKIKNYELKNNKNINLPRPMLNSNNFDFSFSGLKTALLYELKKDADWQKRIPEYAYEFQQAVIDVLIGKTIKAVKKYNVKNIMLSGGVAANVELRKQMAAIIKIKIPDASLHIPELQYTTDNAAMVATAGYYKALRKKFIPWKKVKAECNLNL